MAKQTIKQRKAIRSAAAKKGWDTRIARERREIEASEDRAYALAQEALDRVSNAHVSPSSFEVVPLAPPNPSLWQRIKGWFA